MTVWKILKWFAYTAITGLFSLLGWFIVQATTTDSKSLALPLLRRWVSDHTALAIVLTAGWLLGSAALWVLADIQERLVALAGAAPLLVERENLRPVDFDLAAYADYYQDRPELASAREALAEKGRVLIKGSPLAGKTRMAYELAKRCKSRWVLRVAPDFGNWKGLDIPRYPLIYKPSILWVIDDLDKSVGRTSLAEVERKLSGQAKLQVLVTCRTGEEWKRVEADQPMHAFADTFPQILCSDFSASELKELAEKLGKTVQVRMYQGTPGGVTLGLDRMRDRLEHAETAQQAMRAMYLLRQAAIFRPAVKVLAATISGVYAPAATPEDLEPKIAWLVDNAFLERSGGRIWPTHDVYVTRDFFNYYVEGSPTLDAHLNRLGEIFELAKLANELQSLGISFLSKQDYVAGLRWLQAAAIFTTNDARLYVNIAVAYSGQGQHENAVANLRQAAAIRPDFAETYSRLGYALNSLDLRSEAIEAWKQAVRLGSNDANLRYNLGVLLTWAGQHQEAAAQFREGLRLQPETPDAQYNLGINLLRLNLLQEAVACFREAVRMKPTEPRFHYELAGALAQDQQVQEAIAEYRATLQLKPEMVAAHHNLGNLLYTAGSVDEAFEEWRQEAALDPRAPDPRFNMALMLADRGEIDQAIKQFEEVIVLKPDMARAYINLGRLWKARGRNAESIQSLRGGVREEPENYGYRLLLADALTSAEQYDEAIHEYRESIRLRESLAGHYNLALALRSVGRYKEALAEFSEAAHLDPTDADAHYELGVSHHGNGQLDLALDECHKAVVLKPDIEMERGVYNYGFLLICGGRVMEAIAEFRRILAVKADAPEANTGLGLALSAAHKDQEALPFHEKAVRLKPDSGAIHHCYGLTLKALGRQEEAEREFAEARRLGYESQTSQTKAADAAAGAIRPAPGP